MCPWQGHASAKHVFFKRISVTTQVGVSCRVPGYKLALRDRPTAKKERGNTGVFLPMARGCSVDEE